MPRRARLDPALGVLGVAVVAPVARAHDGEVHPPPAAPPAPRAGVLIADHGERPEWKADTYERVRELFRHLVDMGVVPSTRHSYAACSTLATRSTIGRWTTVWEAGQSVTVVSTAESRSTCGSAGRPTSPKGEVEESG